MPEDPNDQTPGSPGPEDALSEAEQAAKDAAENIDDAGDTADEGSAAALAAAMSAIRMTQNAADEAVTQAQSAPPAPRASKPASADLKDAVPLSLSDLAAAIGSGKKETLDLLSDVQLSVRIELGRTRMYVEDILQLGDGAVVELDKLAGDPVDVFVNERHVARGEVLVLNDNFCVRINEILDPGQALIEK